MPSTAGRPLCSQQGVRVSLVGRGCWAEEEPGARRLLDCMNWTDPSLAFRVRLGKLLNEEITELLAS